MADPETVEQEARRIAEEIMHDLIGSGLECGDGMERAREVVAPIIASALRREREERERQEALAADYQDAAVTERQRAVTAEAALRCEREERRDEQRAFDSALATVSRHATNAEAEVARLTEEGNRLRGAFQSASRLLQTATVYESRLCAADLAHDHSLLRTLRRAVKLLDDAIGAAPEGAPAEPKAGDGS